MKPIIMSTEDVRALLDGRKTMIRRVIKFPGDYLVHRYDGPEDNGMHLFAWGHVMPTLHVQVMGVKQTGGVTFCDGYYEVKAPCQPGDVLWVRETWRVGAWDDEGSICVDYKADGFARREWLKISDYDLYEELWQQSSDDAREANAAIDGDGNYTWMIGQAPTRWRSPITMPREAARLFLRVTDVRVERVQDISPEDCEPWVWVIEFERIEKGEES